MALNVTLLPYPSQRNHIPQFAMYSGMSFVASSDLRLGHGHMLKKNKQIIHNMHEEKMWMLQNTNCLNTFNNSSIIHKENTNNLQLLFSQGVLYFGIIIN